MFLLAILEKCLFKSLVHLVIRLFGYFDIKLYELFVFFGNESLINSIMWKYFSLILQVVFILFMVSFAMQKFLCLIRSLLFIFVSISINLANGLKNIAVIYVKECSVFTELWKTH